MIERFFIPVAILAVATLGGCNKNTSHSMGTPPDNAMIAEETPLQEKDILPETRFAAGQVAEARGDNETAILQYRRVLVLDKNHTKSMYRLGCVYALLGRYTQSIEMWNRYIKATDNSATGYSNLAYTEELAGKPFAAEFDYKKGIEKDPTNEPCRVNYGLMLARHGRMGEAIIQLQAVLSPAQVHYNLAEVYSIEHRTEMAKIEYQEALTLDPNFTDAKNKLASLGEMIDED